MIRKIMRKFKNAFRSAARAFLCIVSLEHAAKGGGGRQAATKLDGIRKDHIGRYLFACQFIKKDDVVLDCACGTGYGASILANRTGASKVIAVDKDKKAIDYARKYYSTPGVNYRREDIFMFNAPNAYFDVIISLETIEHLDGTAIMKYFHDKLKPKGLLIVSTPNEEKVPFNKRDFPFHLRHYTLEEFSELLIDNGFAIKGRFTQYSRDMQKVSEGWGGLYNIAVAEK